MKKLSDESGQTLVMVALSIAVLLGFMAFATDIGVMLHEKRVAQSAADSAAIAAAWALSEGADVNDAGQAAAAAAGFTDGAVDSNGYTTSVKIYSQPIDGHFSGQPGYVEAVIKQQMPTFFMHVFGKTMETVGVRAVATDLGTSDACGRINNSKGSDPAGHPWGNSTIESQHCGWLVNGNLTLGASDSVDAAYIAATGTITGIKHITGTYEENTPPFSDPLSYLQQPEDVPNGYMPKDNGDGTCTAPTGADGVTPLCFLNQPLVNGSDGKIPDGVYFYDNGAASTYTGNIVGDAVTIVLTNGSLLSVSGKSGAGNASLNLTAPKDGPYGPASVVLDAPNYAGELNLDFGATASTYNGTVYAPYADLSLQDQGANGTTSTGFGVTINGSITIGTLDVYNKDNGNLILNSYLPGVISPFPRISLVE